MYKEDECRRLNLADGRHLGYALYGDPEGYPLFYFHGLPGSRYEGRIIDPVARQFQVRVIAVDRPGYGLSDAAPSRSLLAWPKDVASLADALGIEEFGVLGVSGGGPCALACAHELARRVTTVSVVCGLGPLYNEPIARDMRPPARAILRIATLSPLLLQVLIAQPLRAACRLSPALVIWAVSVINGGPDKPVLREAQLKQVLELNVKEAFRAGAAGAARDVSIYTQPWGFRLRDIRQSVMLWHDDVDNVVPPSHGRYMHRQLPKSQLIEIPGEGHFSLPVKHLKEILLCALPQ